LVRGGSGRVDAIALGGEIERVGRSADGDACELVGARIENEDVAAGVADTPDFVTLSVFAEIGDGRADGNFGDGVERDEIDDGEGAVGGGDVGVHVEGGVEEGGAMLVEDDDGGGEKEGEEDKIDADGFERRHVVKRG